MMRYSDRDKNTSIPSNSLTRLSDWETTESSASLI